MQREGIGSVVLGGGGVFSRTKTAKKLFINRELNRGILNKERYGAFGFHYKAWPVANVGLVTGRPSHNVLGALYGGAYRRGRA